MSSAVRTDDRVADALVTAAQAGDRRAIAALVTSSHPHVHRLARTLCSNPQDAEDAAQQALVVLFGQIGTLRATAALSSWLFRIVLNECIRHARVALRPPPPDATTASSSAEDALMAQLETERLIDAIAALPADQRSVLVMRDIQGYSGMATAEALGLSKAAMKSRLHRARATVRHELTAEARR